MSDKLDFLAARLHGRRSQMAEGARLNSLCRARTLPQFASEVLPGQKTETATEMQRELVQALAREVTRIALQLPFRGAELVLWLAMRFQVENLKVVLRGIQAGVGPDALKPHLLTLPRELLMDVNEPEKATSVDELLSRLPRGLLRESLEKAVYIHGKDGRSFLYESALDGGYFRQLLRLTEALAGEDKELVRPLVSQEIDTYHLMVVARGKFGYRLEDIALLPMRVPGTGISRGRFAAMLADTDLRTAASRTLGRALDVLPTSARNVNEGPNPIAPEELEALAWNRFLRLANRAFRRSHMGLAAVVAFVEMRRVEVANLITISEGIRGQLPEERVRSRLNPRPNLEAAHV